MKAKTVLSVLLGIALLALMPITAQADSITPGSYSDTLILGESVTITKTVTIDDAPPTSAKVDVLFLFDTTGSMGSLISAAKTNASTILSNAAGLGDVAFGVAHYEDFPVSPYGGSGDTPFALVNDLTDAATAQAGINSLSLGYGMDGPESNLYALHQSATDVSWRDDSTRILVWFGDAPGHDGDLEPGYPSDVGLADAIDALNAEDIVVQAVGLGSYFDSTGQATAIAAGTGGAYYPSVDTGAIVDVIDDAIISTFATYDEVTLEVVGADNVSVSYTPTVYDDGYTRDTVRTFDFDVTFTGDALGVDVLEIHALVDGGLVGIEYDTITVDPIPEPATMLLVGSGLLGLAGYRRRKKD